MDDKNVVRAIIIATILLATLIYFKTPKIEISSTGEQSRAGLYQFFPERNLVFDTENGAIYLFDESNDQKKLILLAVPQADELFEYIWPNSKEGGNNH